MRINNNMQAMNTNRQLGNVNNAQAKSMEKLSSGYRINRAGDDAAGLAISEKMRGQISGLDQASRNAEDGISLIQTAEGALNETQNILQRMRELSVQSSTDTNTDADRAEIQKEVDQLATEITRISTDTEFNTKSLLNGDLSETDDALTFHIGANEGQNVKLKIADMSADALKVSGNAKIEVTAGITDSDGSSAADDIAGKAADGKYTIDGTDLKDTNGTVVAVSSNAGKVWTGNGNGDIGNDIITFAQNVDTGTITIADNKVTADSEFKSDLQPGDYDLKFVSGASTLQDSSGEIVATSTDDVTFKSVDGSATTMLTLDAAATADMEVSVSGIDVSSQTAANDAITTINDAITSVSSERSKLGAVQNRLEYTISNLDTSAENLQAAESRVRDVDMATEMMEFTKNNILSSAATSMLSQANQAPQSVLQLLQ